MKIFECGLIYVAWGDFFVQEAAKSALSAKRHGGYSCVLVTDGDQENIEPFDFVINTPFQKSYRDKIKMQMSPFEKTIFLDSDTFVADSLDPLFQLLDRFDVFFQAATGGIHYTIEGVPVTAFPEPSAGIIGFRKSEAVEQFFDCWTTSYDQMAAALGNGAWDQRSMRQALWETDVRITYIQHDWQFYTWAANILLGPVRIIHGRGVDYEAVLKKANSHIDYRLVLSKGCLLPLHLTTTRQYWKFLKSIAYLTLRTGVRRLLHHLRLWRLPSQKREM